MQASSPAVAAFPPAALSGMSRSRLVPAFLCVALAHAVLLAVFVTANRTSAPRAVQSTAIVAQLLIHESLDEAEIYAAADIPRPVAAASPTPVGS